MGAIKALRAVLGGILCLALLLSLWLTVERQVFHREEVTLPGALVVPVEGDTMAPAFQEGDLAVAVPGEEWSLGDAVLCTDGSLKRLVGTVDGEFIARGDQEPQEAEALLPAGEIRARVVATASGARGAWEFLSSWWGPLAILVVSLLLVGLPSLLGLGREPQPAEGPRELGAVSTLTPRRQGAEAPQQETTGRTRQPSRRGGYRPRH